MTWRAHVCPECGHYFTETGLRMHTGSKRCEVNKEIIPLKAKTDDLRLSMEMAGKQTVVTSVATALQRRKLEDLAGLEVSETKLWKGNYTCGTKEEFWVHGWVRDLWKKCANQGYTRKFYAIMEKLLVLPEDERESEIGLILLGLCDE